MLRDERQLELAMSPYQGIYEAVVPKEHILRRIKEQIDFSFVNPMLRKQYCERYGRPAKKPLICSTLPTQEEISEATVSTISGLAKSL